MPISSNVATNDKKRKFRTKPGQSVEAKDTNLLHIKPALPSKPRRLYGRSHSSLTPASLFKAQESKNGSEISIETHPDGSTTIIRTQTEKERHPDRLTLDRKGLTSIPLLESQPKLRLLSLQHNLINKLEGMKVLEFPLLVFLDMYDNQIEELVGLGGLNNLRVLLLGKNRIKKIEGLSDLTKIEVLDLHGNQIAQIGSGLVTLTELKVLNLAGNQIQSITTSDLQGLSCLQELNLRRNKLKKLLGFSETPNLTKLFLSNNHLQNIEDFSSLAKATSLSEVSIDNNPICLTTECTSFLVSYLPRLSKLNTTQVTEQVRKAAMAWRRNKESSNSAFMDLTSDVCLHYKREEVISNARTNWELLRSETKCLSNNAISVEKSLKNLKPDSDFVLTSLSKRVASAKKTKVPLLPDKKLTLVRSSSQDTENSQGTSSSNQSGQELVKLPPILVPFIKKDLEEKSVSSVGPNIDSLSSMASGESSDESSELDLERYESEACEEPQILDELKKVASPPDCASAIVSNLTITTSSSSDSNTSKQRSIKSAISGRTMHPRLNTRAVTAKVKRQNQSSPAAQKDREQGGDYLIEICGRHLNVYGQGALRFIDKPWAQAKANDVNTVRFNYVNFNSIAGVLHKLKQRFPNIDNYSLKETNITFLGQLNAFAEVQGLYSLNIELEGNPILEKNWRSYAVYRLAHWGLKVLNDKVITEEEINLANEEYQSLSDMVLWTLPEVLLQPLLIRLRVDISHGLNEMNMKKWLLTTSPSLKSVVSKEALQWRKGAVSQEDHAMRQKAKVYLSSLLDETTNAMNKLRLLEDQWPSILHEFVRNTLLDYSQLDMYMKQKIQELNKS